MLDAYALSQEAAELAKQPKIKFPLLKGDDQLDMLLSDMIGPEEAKKIIYGSVKVAEDSDGTVNNVDDMTLFESMEDIGNGILAPPGRNLIARPETMNGNQKFSSK